MATQAELEAHARHHIEMAQGYGGPSDASRYWRGSHMTQVLWAFGELNKISPTGLTPYVSTLDDYAAYFAAKDRSAAA